MWERWEVLDKPVVERGWFITSLSTSIPNYVALYSQAREFAKFLIKNLNPKLIARYYSSALPLECRISSEGITRLSQCEVYHYGTKQQNIFLMTGDSSPFTDHYEFSRSVLAFAKDLNVTKLISIGARWTQPPALEKEPEVLGFASNSRHVDLLKQSGVKILSNEPAPFFSSLVVGLADLYGIEGYKLSVNHGEPMPHPASVKALLNVTMKMLGIEVDTTELEVQAKEMHQKIAQAKEEWMKQYQPRPEERIYG